ncbi:MAG: SEC-C metal-binding domain-containing protein, partial [Lentisphaeraceae bacterium]|nr:SEC-C metal-binding domain-containing protein [Lentisphaeraceae bacterium]
AELGGLQVIGAARHDSRRIDRQLRGRCARQGDPGSTIFYISLEDNLMRLFGSDRITNVLERLGMEEGEELESGMLTKVIERAQKRVEQQNFSQRKRTLEYDDVMNQQRSIIYELRKDVLVSENPKERLLDIVKNAIEEKFAISQISSKNANKAFKKEDITVWISSTFPIEIDLEKIDFNGGMSVEQATSELFAQIVKQYEKKEALEDPERIRWLEQHIMLTAIDKLWKEHLHGMDHLRQSVMFAHMAQKDPLVEYKQQAYILFDELTANIVQEVLNNMFRSATTLAAIEDFLHSLPQFTMSAEDAAQGEMEQRIAQMREAGMAPPPQDFEAQQAPPEPVKVEQVVREDPKVGRNDNCPCGSGKKYKKCCG